LEALCGEKTALLGRALALDDMVYDVSVSMGHVSAKVEGPHGEEYRVRISFERTTGEERRALLALISRQDVALPLLSNELPAECDGIYPLFGASGRTAPARMMGALHARRSRLLHPLR